MLSAENISCNRGQRRLFEAVSFTLNSGSLLNIQGENGSGKSSLLRILCGLSPIEHGSIVWQNNSIHRNQEQYANDMLYIGHLFGLKDDLTAIENIASIAQMTDITISEADIVSLLKRLGLHQVMHLPTMQLSQGQKKRLALSRLWFSAATLWILDEPFSALDTASITLLTAQLNLHLKRGGLVIMTSHQAVEIDAPQQTIRLGT